MAGNTIGTIFRTTTFGESHGPALGCVVDGCPAGIPLDTEAIHRELRRRRPGGGGAGTTRVETDEPELLSGVFEGITLGTPIAILVRNTGQRSGDYDAIRDVYRPGHADWSWEAKYGLRDYRGGGRSSGRETLGRVAAGAIAKVFLASQGIAIQGWVSSVAGIDAPGSDSPEFSFDEIEKNTLRFPNREGMEKIMQLIEELRGRGDSAGGKVSCRVTGIPPGLGDPVFEKLDARIAAAILSLGAVKGIEFGAGFRSAYEQGSVHNDRPLPRSGPARPLPPGTPDLDYGSNNAGGVLGGISTGMPLEFSAVFKPVSSISRKQETVDRQGTVRELIIQGRHDICICPRAVPVVEAMTALVLADLLLLHRADRA
jgi:chorismate synthase